jgi:hypothetical protein
VRFTGRRKSILGRMKSFWGSTVRRFGMAIWGTGSGGVRGEAKWIEEAGRNARLQTPIHVMSSDVAVVDWHVQQKAKGRKWEDVVEFPAGGSAEKLVELMGQPHPRLTQFDMEYLKNYWTESVGRCAFRMMGIDEFGRPSELWPIPPHWIHRLPTPQEPWFVINFWGFTETIDVPAAEMLYHTRPDPMDPMLKSIGLAQGVDNEVNIDNSMSRFNDFYFKNFAMLGVMLGIPGYDENKEEIDAAFREKHTGSDNAFRTFIADSSQGNVTASNLAPALRDLNFQEGRKQTRDFIREAWQIPPERCGVIENSNRSTIDGADYFQQSKNVLPRLKRWAQEYDLKLTPLFDNRNKRIKEKNLGRLRLWFENPVAETAEHLLKVTQAGFRAGWISINEARTRHGMDKVAGGDVFLIPTNNVTAVPVDGDFANVGQKPKKEAGDGTTQ